MSVVLRCPNCGTTRSTPGECEACNEARARYFCTNHDPGVWLAAATCPRCGARFGEPVKSASSYLPGSTIRPPAPSSAVPPVRVREPTRALGEVRPLRPPASSPRVLKDRDPPPDALDAAPEGWPMPPWQKVLGAVLSARSATAAARARERRPSRAGGCLGRLAVFALLLAFALGIALYFLSRSLMHSLSMY
ncbi:MAG: hypothetical protein ABW061_28285 [Polyangiaceae bacterium]